MARVYNLARLTQPLWLASGTGGGGRGYSQLRARAGYQGVVNIYFDGTDRYFQVRDVHGTQLASQILPALTVSVLKNRPGTSLWFLLAVNNTTSTVTINLFGGGTVSAVAKSLSVLRLNESGQIEAAWNSGTIVTGSSQVTDYDFDVNAAGVGYAVGRANNGASTHAYFRVDCTGSMSTVASSTASQATLGYRARFRQTGLRTIAVSDSGVCAIIMQENADSHNGWAVDVGEDATFSARTAFGTVAPPDPFRTVRVGSHLVGWFVGTNPQIGTINQTTGAFSGFAGQVSTDSGGGSLDNSSPWLVPLGTDKVGLFRWIETTTSWTTTNLPELETGETVTWTKPSLNVGQSAWWALVGVVWEVPTGKVLNTAGYYWGASAAVAPPSPYESPAWSAPAGEDHPLLCFQQTVSWPGATRTHWMDWNPNRQDSRTVSSSTDVTYTGYAFPTMRGLVG